ncbi:TIGR01244 family sulfur transferase [Qipengyuania sp. RANM35]|uniref:TIGR01244 family sulfur transferase n=1 Tax=Qipengyuania sp. RANM35 TaxID=3068635 RepID=UPI0034DB13D3
MECKQLTEGLSVRGQITPADIEAIKAQGFARIICNRPDGEKPDQPCADDVRAAVEAAGLEFVHNPIVPGGITPEAVEAQRKAIAEADGPVLAYCGSGQRATALWMVANPHGLSADDRIKCATDAGYDLAMLRPRL